MFRVGFIFVGYFEVVAIIKTLGADVVPFQHTGLSELGGVNDSPMFVAGGIVVTS